LAAALVRRSSGRPSQAEGVADEARAECPDLDGQAHDRHQVGVGPIRRISREGRRQRSSRSATGVPHASVLIDAEYFRAQG
jgi:hypothetical protein